MRRGTDAVVAAPVPRDFPVRMGAVAATPVLLSPLLANGYEAVQIDAHARRRGVPGAGRRHLHGVLGTTPRTVAGKDHLGGLHRWCDPVDRHRGDAAIRSLRRN